MTSCRIAILELKQETNTFSPLTTSLGDFESAGYLLRGAEIRERLAGTNTEIGGFLCGGQQRGWQVEPLFAAWALSGGRLTREAHAFLKQSLLSPLRQGWPFDGILIALHGALVAEDCDDVEGDLLAAIREVVGAEVPLVCTLDMHANVTSRIVDNVSAVVAYHTNPHTDMADCGQRGVQVLDRILRESLQTACVFKKLPLVIPPENSATTEPLMGGLIDCLREFERDEDVLAAGLFPVQPWLDIPDLGCAAVVTSVGEAGKKAKRLCRDLAGQFWSRRHEFLPELNTIEEALAIARGTRGLCVLANSSDSTGSGSPGDATDLLRELLRLSWPRTALLSVVDPEAVEAAFAAGLAAPYCRRVGGKLDCVFNEPVQLIGEVSYVGEPSFRIEGTAFSGVTVQLGRSAVVRSGHVHVLLTTNRPWTHDPSLYRCVGLQPEHAHIAVVKSPLMYRTAYRAIAERMIAVDSAGASPSRFVTLPYTRVDRTMFPFDTFRQFTPLAI